MKIWHALVLLGLVMIIVARCNSGPLDDTDPPNGRSGMGLRTDHRTGCQYLTSVSVFGESSITPRLDSSGRHICNAALTE